MEIQRFVVDKTMFELIIETDFSAAHNLREYKGQCERLHGHNWKVQVVLKSEKVDKLGMVMDFRDAKRVVGEIINRFDHVYLNELADFAEVNPTTENLSKILYEELRHDLPAGVKVEKVTTWESDRCGASYFE